MNNLGFRRRYYLKDNPKSEMVWGCFVLAVFSYTQAGILTTELPRKN
jgi:hypothetical protein